MDTWGRQKRLILYIHLAFFVMVIVPFLLWEAEIYTIAAEYLSGDHELELMAIVAGLLMLDVFLPVPSSLVGTSAGIILGWELGFLSCFVGLTLGSLVGYAVGYLFRKTFFHRYFSDDEFRNLSFNLSQYGFLTLIACRGVPVLAEMSVLIAGFHRFGFGRFLLATTIANFFVAGIHTYLGVTAAESESIYFIAIAFLFVPVFGYPLRFLWRRKGASVASVTE